MEAFWWKNYHQFHRITLCDYFSHDYLLCNTTASNKTTTKTTLNLPTIFNVMFIPSYIIIMSKLEKFQFIIFAFSPHFLLFEIRQLCPSFSSSSMFFYFHFYFFCSFILFNPKKSRPKTIMWRRTTIKQRFALIHTHKIQHTAKTSCIVESLNHTTKLLKCLPKRTLFLNS